MVRPTAARSLTRSLASSSSSNLPSTPTTSQGSSLLQRAASSLLPPLPLYRRLLRAHRTKLSYEMRSLGDNYLRDEFRRHKAVTNPLQVVGFLGAWKIYLDQLEQPPAADESGGEGVQGEKKRAFFEGRRLSSEEFEKLSDEQLYQLHEFMTATQDLYDPNSKTAPGPPGPPSADGSAETAQTGPQGSSQQQQGGAVEGGGVGGGVGGAVDGEGRGSGNGQSEGEKALRDILESSAPERRR